MAWTKTTTTGTKHKNDCKMAFGRKDATCPRCQELLAGAAPIAQPWRATKKEAEYARILEIRNHSCIESKCGPVCTHGEW